MLQIVIYLLNCEFILVPFPLQLSPFWLTLQHFSVNNALKIAAGKMTLQIIQFVVNNSKLYIITCLIIMGCVYSELKTPHCECVCINDSITAINDNANANEERPSYLKILDGAIENKLTDGITKSASSCNPYHVDRSHFSESIQLLGIGKHL